MQTIDIRRLKDVKPDVLEVYEILKEYMEPEERREFVERHKLCWDAIENKMWTDKEEKVLEDNEQVPLVINKCNKGVQGSSAIVTDSKPEIKFLPIGSSDLYVAELLKRGHDFAFTKNEGSDVIYQGVEECKVGGVCFWESKYNKGKGLFGCLEFDESYPLDYYWSKDSRKRDFSDTHLLKAKLRSPSYVKSRYDVTDEDLKYTDPTDADMDESKSEGITGGDNYAVDNKLKSDPINTKEKKSVWEIEAWLLKTEIRYFKVVVNDGEVSHEDIDKKEYNKNPDLYHKQVLEYREQRIIVGKKLISKKKNPNGVDSDGNPVMSVVGLKHQRTRTSYPMSPTAYAVFINKEKNKRRMQFIAGASQEINGAIVEPAGKVKWIGKPGNPNSRVQVDSTAGFQPHRMASGGMDISKFIALEDRADRDIDDQYDLQDVMRGKAPEGERVSGRMVLALQDMGGMMSKPFLRALESAMVRLAKVNIAILLREWPRSMWERLIEPDEVGTWTPDGKYERVDPDNDNEEDAKMMYEIAQKWDRALELIRPKDMNKPSGIDLIDLDVKMVAGSSMPTNRIAKFELAVELFQAGIYDRQAALDLVDDPDKEKIVARMKLQEKEALAREMMKGTK